MKGFPGVAVLAGLVLGVGLGYQLKRMREPAPGATVPPANLVAEIYAGVDAAPADLLVAGDSIAQYGPWGELLNRPALVEGIGGESAAQLAARGEELQRHHPKVLIVISGANDIRHHTPAAHIAANLGKLLERHIAPKVIVLGVLPMSAEVGDQQAVQQADQAIQQMAERNGAIYVAPPKDYSVQDTMDGLHPDLAGYRKLAAALKSVL